MKFIDKEKFVNLGFQVKDRMKDISFGLLLGFLIIGSGLVLLLALNQVEFQKMQFNFKELLLAVLMYIIVAITEEVLFRGYVLRNFMNSFNNYIALVISSVFFALAHGFNPDMDWFSFLSIFLAGILLGASYIYTKNLWFPIALHFSWNFFQTFFGFNVSGQEFYSFIVITINSKNRINGGDFGFEGSILSLIAQLLVITLIFFYYEHIKPKRLNSQL